MLLKLLGTAEKEKALFSQSPNNILVIQSYLLYDVRMFDSFKERDLTDSCGGNSVVFLLQSDFLKSHICTIDQVFALVNNTISTFSELLFFLVSVQLRGFLAEFLL